MTITTLGDKKQVEQIVKQLDKMIDSVEVKHLDEQKTIFRELCIFKIKLSITNDSMEVNKLANAYGGNVHDVLRAMGSSGTITRNTSIHELSNHRI